MIRSDRKFLLKRNMLPLSLPMQIVWVGLIGWLSGDITQHANASNGPKPTGAGNILQRSGIQQGPKGPKAQRLLRVYVGSHRVRLVTDGSIPQYEAIVLRKPTRLVLDLYRIPYARFRSIRRALHSNHISCRKTPFRRVRIGKHPRRIRIVFDACKPNLLSYRIQPFSRGLLLQFYPSKNSRFRLTKAQVKLSRSPTTIVDIGYGENQTHSTILIRLQGQIPTPTPKSSGRTLTLDLPQTRLAKELQQTLDVSEFRGAIQRIQTSSTPQGTRLSVTLRHRVASTVTAHKHQLMWQFAMPLAANQSSPQRKTAQDGYQIQYNPRRVGQAAGGPGQMTPGDFAFLAQRTGPKRYTGRRMSVFFRNVEIHNLLQLFAEISGLNIITSNSVRGQITLKLRNVPWDQALDIVLKTLKLGMERSGNIIRIATLEELRTEEEQRRKLEQLKLLAQPQKIRLIPVNYANATDMATQVKTVLSPRGTVTIDNRTNVLIVKDYVPFLMRAEGLVRSLDTQTPQVLIQARIVEANVNFSQEFGIQWGGHLLFSPLTGNSTGLQFPNPVGIRGGVATVGGAQGGTGDFGTPNYVINFPATTGVGQGTALSFLFGSLSNVGNLNLRLSAAESSGHVKIISAPKIITLHKVSASIQQGLQIPFSSASAAGTNVQFVTASLSLTVLPQVTTDGSVFLQLNIANNAPDFSKGGAAGPAITTKTAQTNMLIKDGETMVIGGIYSRRTGSSQARVPFLSQIPVIGLLFKNYVYNDDRAELLVFVTPRIINRAQTLGGRQGS